MFLIWKHFFLGNKINKHRGTKSANWATAKQEGECGRGMELVDGVGARRGVPASGLFMGTKRCKPFCGSWLDSFAAPPPNFI